MVFIKGTCQAKYIVIEHIISDIHNLNIERNGYYSLLNS